MKTYREQKEMLKQIVSIKKIMPNKVFQKIWTLQKRAFEPNIKDFIGRLRNKHNNGGFTNINISSWTLGRNMEEKPSAQQTNHIRKVWEEKSATAPSPSASGLFFMLE